MDIVVEKRANLRRNNFLTTDEFAVFIPDSVYIQGTQFIILDKRCKDGTTILNL